MEFTQSTCREMTALGAPAPANRSRVASGLGVWVVGVLSFCAFAGCTSARLRSGTVYQAGTLTDLQHQIVLNNLAMYAGNPDAIPFQANLHDGTTQIADNGQLASIASKPLYVLFTGSRTAVDQWSMTPVTDDIALRLLRKAYRRALGFPDSLYDDDCELANDLAHELKKTTAVVDDIRTTNQISTRTETVQRLEEIDVADSQKKFVDAFLRFLGESGHRRDLLGHDINEGNRDLERIANDFAEAVGNRDGYLIREYGTQLLERRNPGPPPAISHVLPLVRAIEDVRNHPKKPELKPEVQVAIIRFLSELKGKEDREGERLEAAERLFDVYRLWPEQSTLIGVRHRDASSYRVDDHKVLTSNHSKIIIPTEIGRNEAGFTKKLHDGNLDYVDLGSEYAYIITIDRHAPGLSCTVRLEHCLEDGKLTTFNIPIWSYIQANEVQRPLDLYLPGRFIVSGGPLSVSSPISISYVGESRGKKDGKPELEFRMPEDECSPFRLDPIHRYMKVTPIVAEVRRQVKDVEDDLEKIKSGWFRWSCDKHDVPKGACYTASWKDCGRTTYVWVCQEGRKEFEDFTIKILNFSNLIKEVKLTGASGVKYSPATASTPVR